MTTDKLIEMVPGRVTMADGTTRAASRNTYKVVTNSADGTSVSVTQAVRVEFELFVNANTSRNRRFRKTTEKQAATFRPSLVETLKH